MDQTIIVQFSLIAATIIACVAAACASFCDSRVAVRAIDGMTRQPELAGQIVIYFHHITEKIHMFFINDYIAEIQHQR